MEKLLLWLKQPSRPKPKEKEERSLKFEFVDETSADQPYVQNGELHHFLDFFDSISMSVLSAEGFARDEEKQKMVGRTLSRLFKLPDRGQVLDVGWGANKFVANGIRQMGGKVSLLDYNSSGIDSNSTSITPSPSRVGLVDDTFPRYIGDFGQISARDSELSKAKFGTIIFNGSWVACGNNWTVMEILSGQYHHQHKDAGVVSYASPEYQVFLDQQLDHLLAEGKQHLSDDGVMILASSRYAFHGAGYSYLSLPEEKLQFLDVIRRVKKMGAKKITVVGVSNEGMEKMFQENVSAEEKIKSRIMQIVHRFFVGGFRGPKYRLKIDGRKMDYSEREAYFSDEKNVEKLLEEHPDMAALIQAELERVTVKGRDVIERLTGGVASLISSDLDPFQSRLAKLIIDDIGDTFLQHIARIDAIAIEF